MKKALLFLVCATCYFGSSFPVAWSASDKDIAQKLSDEDQREFSLENEKSAQSPTINPDCLHRFSLPSYDDPAAEKMDDYEDLINGNDINIDFVSWIRKHPATTRKLYEDTQNTLGEARDKKCHVIAYHNGKRRFTNANKFLLALQKTCSADKKGDKYPYYCPKSFGTNAILNDLKNGALRFL